MKTWTDQLIEEYNTGRKQLEQYRNRLDNDLDHNEHRIVSEMISDMDYALEWMKIGRKPDARRGIDRRSVYQRTAYMSMDIFPALDLEPEETEITQEQKKKIVEVLMHLSDRERECYLLHMAQGLSMNAIALELGIRKGTVQDYILRAKSKINLLV